jgi:hypothetical protein
MTPADNKHTSKPTSPLSPPPLRRHPSLPDLFFSQHEHDWLAVHINPSRPADPRIMAVDVVVQGAGRALTESALAAHNVLMDRAIVEGCCYYNDDDDNGDYNDDDDDDDDDEDFNDVASMLYMSWHILLTTTPTLSTPSSSSSHRDDEWVPVINPTEAETILFGRAR